MEAASTYEARNAAGLQRGAQALPPSHMTVKGLDRPMTEIEAITAQMADTALRLGEVADRIQGRVDGFMQSADVGSPFPTHAAPAPQPGTLGALRYWHGEVETQTNRLNSLASSIAGII